jgi:hypothetical protein
MRTFEVMLLGTIMITLIFLGSLLLLIDLPIFNRIDPLTLDLAYLGLGLGLAFGFFVGVWYTEEQLKILAIKNEFKGLGSKKITAAVYTALAIFVTFSFFMLYFNAITLFSGYILFIISGTFAIYLVRIFMVNSWEKHEKKIVMQENKKFYVIPYPPQAYDKEKV